MKYFEDFMKKYGWILLGFFALFPFLITQLYGINYFHELSDPELSIKEWLLFWTAFVGPAIGGIVALFAVYSSLKQNDKFHEYQAQFQKEQERLKKREFAPWIYAKHYRVLNVEENIEGITFHDLSDLENLDEGDFFIDAKAIVFGRDNVELIEYGSIHYVKNELLWIGKESHTNKNGCTFLPILLKNIGKGFAHKVSFYYKDQKLNSNDFSMQIDLKESYPLLAIIKDEAKSEKYEIGIEYHDLVNQRYLQNICITPQEHFYEGNPGDIRKYYLVYSSDQIELRDHETSSKEING